MENRYKSMLVGVLVSVFAMGTWLGMQLGRKLERKEDTCPPTLIGRLPPKMRIKVNYPTSPVESVTEDVNVFPQLSPDRSAYIFKIEYGGQNRRRVDLSVPVENRE